MEMKHLFGGSGNNIVSFCSTECDSKLTISLINCSGTCTVNPSSSVTCSDMTKVFTKNCDGSSSLLHANSLYVSFKNWEFCYS